MAKRIQKRSKRKALSVYRPRKWAKRRPSTQRPKLFDGGKSEQGDRIGGTEDAAEAGRSAACEHRAAAAAEGGPLFQYNGDCCDNENVSDCGVKSEQVHSAEDLGRVVGEAYRIRPCNCRRWFCEWCGPRLGVRLRDRLVARLATFADVYGITLTVDGSLFASPEEAWQYVMDNRLLSRLVRELDRRGHLHSSAYFWVVEFQKDTQQAHWHLLVDATAIPYGQIVEIWSRFRPLTAPPLSEPITAENYKGRSPAFGSIRFTARRERDRAAYYATKYLTKFPQEGYPDWVLDYEGRMPRFGHSHRFFPRVSGHDPMCFCDECRAEVEPPSKQRVAKKGGGSKARRETKTIRERLAECQQSCSVLKVKRVELPDGTIVDGRGRFEGKLEISFREACEYFGVSPEECWQIEGDGRMVTDLEEFIKQRNAEGEAT